MQSVANCTYRYNIYIVHIHIYAYYLHYIMCCCCCIIQYIWNEGKLIDENGVCIYVCAIFGASCVVYFSTASIGLEYDASYTHTAHTLEYNLDIWYLDSYINYPYIYPHPTLRLAKSHKQQITSAGKGL